MTCQKKKQIHAEMCMQTRNNKYLYIIKIIINICWEYYLH